MESQTGRWSRTTVASRQMAQEPFNRLWAAENHRPPFRPQGHLERSRPRPDRRPSRTQHRAQERCRGFAGGAAGTKSPRCRAGAGRDQHHPRAQTGGITESDETSSLRLERSDHRFQRGPLPTPAGRAGRGGRHSHLPVIWPPKSPKTRGPPWKACSTPSRGFGSVKRKSEVFKAPRSADCRMRRHRRENQRGRLGAARQEGTVIWTGSLLRRFGRCGPDRQRKARTAASSFRRVRRREVGDVPRVLLDPSGRTDPSVRRQSGVEGADAQGE